jgi:regulatory protein YycH of two-component signal transduction system YycFG
MHKQFLIILLVCVVIVFGYLVWHGHKNNTSISSKDVNLKQISSQQKTGKSSQSISTSIKDIGSQQTNSNDEINDLINTFTIQNLKKKKE